MRGLLAWALAAVLLAGGLVCGCAKSSKTGIAPGLTLEEAQAKSKAAGMGSQAAAKAGGKEGNKEVLH